MGWPPENDMKRSNSHGETNSGDYDSETHAETVRGIARRSASGRGPRSRGVSTAGVWDRATRVDSRGGTRASGHSGCKRGGEFVTRASC